MKQQSDPNDAPCHMDLIKMAVPWGRGYPFCCNK